MPYAQVGPQVNPAGIQARNCSQAAQNEISGVLLVTGVSRLRAAHSRRSGFLWTQNYNAREPLQEHGGVAPIPSEHAVRRIGMCRRTTLNSADPDVGQS
jgi:hypothetical protein